MISVWFSYICNIFWIFQIRVVAYDKCAPVHSSVAFVRVTVTRNENQPIFDRTNYEVTIPETQPLGVNITQVKATDADQVRRLTFNPSNAQATFAQSTRMQRFLKKHLNLVMLVFIGKLPLCNLRWVPMCQGFSHFSGFLLHFVLAKLATSKDFHVHFIYFYFTIYAICLICIYNKDLLICLSHF